MRLGQRILRALLKGAPFAAICATVGCGSSDEPGGPNRPSTVSFLSAVCTPASDALRCSARFMNNNGQWEDVTPMTSWSASPPGTAAHSERGLIVPLVAADISVFAHYQRNAQQYMNSNPVEYRMAPGVAPQELTFVTVAVVDADRVTVPGATVEVFTERGDRLSCVRNSGGSCTARPVLMGEQLLLRVMAEGYVPATQIHRVLPFGSGSPFVAAQLARSTG